MGHKELKASYILYLQVKLRFSLLVWKLEGLGARGLGVAHTAGICSLRDIPPPPELSQRGRGRLSSLAVGRV